jgi:hypothetical protein
MNRSSSPRTTPLLLAGVAAAVLLLALTALPPTTAQYYTPPVTLAGHAVLPADTFAPGPPAGSAIMGDTNGRATPFPGQPVQGFSAILPSWNGGYLVLSDNGFGGKGNSSDYRLRWYQVYPLFAAPDITSTVTVAGYTELSDPERLVSWPIVNDQGDRVLTGADFDPESFQQAPDGSFWFGEEFGPFLLHTSPAGALIEPPIALAYPPALAPLMRGQPFIQSPEHPAFFSLPDRDAKLAAANIGTSRGIEGMALNRSGTKLYPILEGALLDDADPTRRLILEYDIVNQQFTENYWFYVVDNPNHAIGELTAINDNQFLIIERDNSQGQSPAFKRIYQFDLRSASPATAQKVAKALVVDLMAIADPRGYTQPEPEAIGLGPVFMYPFVTIESVYPVDAQTLIVVNDNNYPFSLGRRPGSAIDTSEFILLRLAQPLNLGE